MITFATIRRFVGEFDAMFEHARTGRPPKGDGWKAARITSQTVDGWYNFHADASHRAFRR